MAPGVEDLLGLGEEGGAGALRADLDDAVRLFGGGDHGGTVCHSVGHGLFAVDVFAGGEGVNHDLLVPVVGDGDNDSLDVFVGEQLLILAGDGDVGAGNFFGEGLAAVPEIAGGETLGAREVNGGLQEARALHADADDAEVDDLAEVSRHPLLCVGGFRKGDGPGGERE